MNVRLTLAFVVLSVVGESSISEVIYVRFGDITRHGAQKAIIGRIKFPARLHSTFHDISMADIEQH